MELKGPDNSLRVRQIRVLGEIEGGSLKIGKQLSAQTIQQRNCEAETLKVFRLITSQVSLISYNVCYFSFKILYSHNVSYCRYLGNLYKETSNNRQNRQKALTKIWRIVMIFENIWSEYYLAEVT